MAFQMIHMEIAYRVMQKLGIPEGREEFLLGSVAPDAVHMRDDYKVEDKIHSHLFEGCGPWGDTRDYDRWIANIHSFWEKFGKNEIDINRRMLIAGIFTHCKTDYWNDVTIWRGTQREFIPPMDPDKFKQEFYVEARAVDEWLYFNGENTKEIRELLGAAKEEGLADYYTTEDVVKLKKNLLSIQYAGISQTDLIGFRYYTREKLEKFLADVTEDVAKDLTDLKIFSL